MTSERFLSKIKKQSTEKLSKFLQEHPNLTRTILEASMKLIASEIESSHIDLIVEAMLEKRQVVLIGPHYSVADIGGFYKVLEKIKNHPKINLQDTEPIVMGPASSKFFSHKKEMFAKVLVAPLGKLGIELFRVAQVQDKDTRESLTESEINEINFSAWLQIARGMRQGKILAVFPTGTRENTAGVTRAPEDVCVAIDKRLKDDALVVPVITEGSDRLLGKGMPIPDFTELAVAITSFPITYGAMKRLAAVINKHLKHNEQPIHPIEIANLLTVLDKPERWGDLSPFIELLMDPTEELLAELETILPAVTNTEYLMDFPNVNLGLLTNSLIDGLSIK